MSEFAKVGVALATQVACKLETGAILAYRHRDYCGVGLRYADKEYICGEVFEGDLPSRQEIKSWPGAERMERSTFSTRADFVAWLGEQSDESLSGKQLPDTFSRNNQRLSLERLRQFVSSPG